MQRPALFLSAAIALCSVSLPLAGQKLLFRSIQFKGAPEYSEQELLEAAGFKKGAPMSTAELGDHSKQLMNTGVFENIYYRLEGPDLVITLTPGQNVYPLRIENLPLTPGKDLDAMLHARFPLYHGKVPSEGTLLDGVRSALEEALASQGIKVTVTSTPFASPGTREATVINFSIVSPEVRIGPIHIDGVSPEMQGKMKALADHIVGTPFETETSAENLEHALETVCADEGYAAAKIHAARSGDPVVAPAAIAIPFSVTVQEGRLYKLGAVHVPANALLTQAEIDKAIAAHGETAAKGQALRFVRPMIESRYKSKGYLDYTLTLRPEFDESAGTVNYTMDINAGPVYHLGFVKFDNVSDDLRRLLIRNWQMLPGDPFDEGYVANFILTAQKADPVLMRSLAGVKAAYDIRADTETHEVNCVLRFEKIH
jgi:outer membrane protein assembly factor BamA